MILTKAVKKQKIEQEKPKPKAKTVPNYYQSERKSQIIWRKVWQDIHEQSR